MPLRSYILALIVTLLWGFNFVFAKTAVLHFEPFTLLSIRYLIISLLLIPFFPKPPVAFKDILLLSTSFSLFHLGTMFLALKVGLDASIGVVALQTHVPFLLILGIIFFKEKVGKYSIFGLILAFIGSILLMKAPNSIDNPVGFWLMIFSAFSVAVYGAHVKKLAKVNTVALIAWVAFVSFPIMFLLSFYFESNQIRMITTANNKVIISLLYITIGTAIIGHSVWAYLLARNPVSAIAPITLLIPVIGVFAGVYFLDEEISMVMFIGATLVIIGAGIVLFRRPNIVKTDPDL
jgi:O-acetylserine/cysteine efflux transporter